MISNTPLPTVAKPCPKFLTPTPGCKDNVLTAKLEILRNRKRDYVAMLKHYIPMVRKPKEEDQGTIEINAKKKANRVEI